MQRDGPWLSVARIRKARGPAGEVTADRVTDIDGAFRDFREVLDFVETNGLIDNMFSTAGGTPNDLDTLENVWLHRPTPGTYEVEVRATAIREDSHVETGAIDADYALVVSGLAGLRDRRGMELDLGSTQRGDLTITLQKTPASYAGGLTLLSVTTQRPISSGRMSRWMIGMPGRGMV